MNKTVYVCEIQADQNEAGGRIQPRVCYTGCTEKRVHRTSSLTSETQNYTAESLYRYKAHYHSLTGICL